MLCGNREVCTADGAGERRFEACFARVLEGDAGAALDVAAGQEVVSARGDDGEEWIAGLAVWAASTGDREVVEGVAVHVYTLEGFERGLRGVWRF